MARLLFHMLNACSHPAFLALRASLAAGLMGAMLVGTTVAGPADDATAAYERNDYSTVLRLANQGDLPLRLG
jgi:hypothetical protein